MKKAMVIETLISFDAETLIARLLFIEKLEKGLQDVKDGRVINYTDMKKAFLTKLV